MKIWCKNNENNDIYKSILNNHQINVDIGNEQDDTLIIPVTINIYDKSTNTLFSTYTHSLSIIQIISYIMSFPRHLKEYDFEIIRLDKINDKIHKDKSIQLLNESLKEHQHIKNIFADTFDTEENKLIYNKICNTIHIIEEKIDKLKTGLENDTDSIDNN